MGQTTEPVATRLRRLRDRAGMTRDELAKAANYKRGTSIQRYEDPALFTKDFLPLDVVQKLAPALTGRGVPPITEEEVMALAHPAVKRAVEAPMGGTLMTIDELDVRGGAGGAGAVFSEVVAVGGSLLDQIPTRQRWVVGSELARPVTNSPTESLKIITVVGNSMLPDFPPGQKVLVDTCDRTPSPPGVFVAWDGLSVVIKQVYYVPHSDPPTVVFQSKNPDYPAYERSLEEAYIHGRVIGAWSFT